MPSLIMLNVGVGLAKPYLNPNPHIIVLNPTLPKQTNTNGNQSKTIFIFIYFFAST